CANRRKMDPRTRTVSTRIERPDADPRQAPPVPQLELARHPAHAPPVLRHPRVALALVPRAGRLLPGNPGRRDRLPLGDPARSPGHDRRGPGPRFAGPSPLLPGTGRGTDRATG